MNPETITAFQKQQSNCVMKLCTSFSVANIELSLAIAAAAAASSSQLVSFARLPLQVFTRVEDHLPCLQSQDLPLHQLVVEPTAGHQLIMRPLLNHTALVNHYDVVCFLHCAQPMSDHQDCVVPHDFVQCLLNLQ